MTKTAKKILANDFSKLWEDVGPKVLTAVSKVGESGWFILGKEVSDFEETLARRIGASFAVGCGNGLDAIELSLRALQIKPGEKVITTPLSAFATTLAIIRAGGIPVFVDVTPSGLLDLNKAEEVIKADSSISFMVPVHLYGHIINLEDLKTLKNKYSLSIVEDCAQAIDGTSANAPVGSVGDCATYSFYPTKNLGAIGDGGAVTTNSEELASTIKSLRDYGQTAKYEHTLLGMNSRLDEVQAAILNNAFLPKLSEWTSIRRSHAQHYLKNIENNNIKVMEAPIDSQSVYHLFPILTQPSDRDDFINYLSSNGIQANIHYPKLIPDQSALRDFGPLKVVGSLDNASLICNREVSLPIHPYLSDEDLDKVVSVINAWVP